MNPLKDPVFKGATRPAMIWGMPLVAFLMVGGGILTITVFAAFAGIPLALFGIWMWRSSSRNIATVETAFSEFIASRPA